VSIRLNKFIECLILSIDSPTLRENNLVVGATFLLYCMDRNIRDGS